MAALAAGGISMENRFRPAERGSTGLPPCAFSQFGSFGLTSPRGAAWPPLWHAARYVTAMPPHPAGHQLLLGSPFGPWNGLSYFRDCFQSARLSQRVGLAPRGDEGSPAQTR